MPSPKSVPPWRDPLTLNALQALAGLGFIFAGAAAVSIPCAFLLAGLILWRDASSRDDHRSPKTAGESKS